jgi:steroid 5-alpha reductase family enzyme
MFVLWLLGWWCENFSYADVGWSVNFVVLAFLYGAHAPGYAPKKWLMAAMFALHGARLAWHLALRIFGHPEDSRYVQTRRDWVLGGRASMNVKFLLFFESQALLNIVLSVPLLIVAFNTDTRWHTVEIVGACIFLVALLGESLADAQLAAFKIKPANKAAVCDTGLWRYSRHPNYFFEWLIWIAYATFAFASPHGRIAIGAPVLMLYLLIRVTGLKPNEEQALRTKEDLYRDYQARTSSFIPWFPKCSVAQARN